jgi:hypothetical protein
VKEPKFKEFLLIPEYKHKEAYPYEWMDSFTKFDFPFLPPREAFYSRITEKTINEAERYSTISRDIRIVSQNLYGCL